MYTWRKLTPDQRQELLDRRRALKRPWHSPPHYTNSSGRYLITAACYEHKPYVFHHPERIEEFTCNLLDYIQNDCEIIHAWVVLPNHYHFLASSNDLLKVFKSIKQLHGSSSFNWNKEENTKGRKVWCGITETRIKSERHFWASLNYVLHNPVKHGYVKKWDEWPWSNARDYLKSNDRQAVLERWNEYPINEYGKGWDEF